MESFDIKDSWNYFRSLSEDMAQTSCYVEPRGQEDVFSIEFAKIIILSCVELESVFKAICVSINGKEGGSISEYKDKILAKYPSIVEAEVEIPRSGEKLKPFAGWASNRLFWWDAYNDVKHTRGKQFNQASYKNAVYALSGLYIAILYYQWITKARFSNADGGYITSDYSDTNLTFGRIKNLPGFEEKP